MKTKITFDKAELEQFTGDNTRWQHTLNPAVTYTRGVKYLVDRCDAYWLLLLIGSFLIPKDAQVEGDIVAEIFGRHCWQFDVIESQHATLSASADVGAKPFLLYATGCRNFPLASVTIWADFAGDKWLLHLPSEH